MNPLNLYVGYTPIRDLPTTFLYCCPVTVLEWNIGHDTVMPPVVNPESFINYHSHLHDFRGAIFTVRSPVRETYAR